MLYYVQKNVSPGCCFFKRIRFAVFVKRVIEARVRHMDVREQPEQADAECKEAQKRITQEGKLQLQEAEHVPLHEPLALGEIKHRALIRIIREEIKNNGKPQIDQNKNARPSRSDQERPPRICQGDHDRQVAGDPHA